MCPTIFGGSGPMSLPYSFVFPGQLKNWFRVQMVAPKLYYCWATDSPLQYQVSAAGVFFFLMRRVSPLFFHQPAKVSVLQSHLRRRRCVEWAWFNTHPAVGFSRSYRHPRSFRCNRTRCGGETYRNNKEIFTAGRGLDTTLSSPFCSCILFAIVEQLIKLKFLVQQVELKWLILNRWWRLFHSSRVKFPSVKMSASWCLVSV